MKLETNPSSFLSDNIASMFWQNRKAMAIICAIAFVCSVVVSFLITPKYKATTIMFTNLNNNIGHSIISPLPDARDYMAFGEEKACEQMIQVLSSQAVMRVMMKKYDLMHYYKIAPDEPAKYSLLKYYYTEEFKFDITEYQSIEVDVEDAKPEMAAIMANGVVQVADSIYGDLLKQHAVKAFEVAKMQRDSANKEISKLEDSMTVYRKKGMMNYKDQVKELTRGYSDAIVKGSPANEKEIEDKLQPFEEYGKQYSYYYNALLDRYTIMQQLDQSYVEAKANVEKAITPFFVVEKAITPDKKYSPVRWLIVVGGTFAGLIFGFFLLLVIKRFSSENNSAL